MSQGANKNLFIVMKRYEIRRNKSGRKEIKYVEQRNCQIEPEPDDDFSIEIKSSFENISNYVNENHSHEEHQ